MGLYKTRSLILSSSLFGEVDKKVIFLTSEGALYTGIAKGAVKSQRRFGGVLEPLTEVSLSFFEKKGNAFVRVEQVDLLNQYKTIKEDLDRLGCGLYLCELVRSGAAEHQKDPRLYVVMSQALADLHYKEPLFVARLFEIRFLNFLGVSPLLQSCARCSDILPPPRTNISIRFRVPMGVICSKCPPQWGDIPLSRQALTQFQTGLKGAEITEERIDPTLEKLLKQLLEYHFGAPMKARMVWERLRLPSPLEASVAQSIEQPQVNGER